MRCVAAVVALLVSLSVAMVARAQTSRRIEVHFTPTARTQLAIWIARDDGTLFHTVRLTDAVAYRGIGNRPGALQMNSAWRWPYGRREGVLPVWAHARAAFTGTAFSRVIFGARAAEGYASALGDDIANTPDSYFCLSHTPGDESLDTVSCASTLSSNKGRYLTAADEAAGYGEPFVDRDGVASTRTLSRSSLYPARRDIACDDGECEDHRDARGFASDALAVMPELDAVSMATWPADQPFAATLDVPEDWLDGSYSLFVEANSEGDYAPGWDPTTYPTPSEPAEGWDFYAQYYGYPYRGQPSVVYRVAFELERRGGEWRTSRPIGYGELHGLDGELRPMDATIADDPVGAPGSGADRLRAGEDGTRVRVVVPATNLCGRDDAPEGCGRACDDAMPCAEPLLCGPERVCVGRCDVRMTPSAPSGVVLEPHGERRHTHEWAVLRFVAPSSARGVQRYEVRVSARPIDDAQSFARARPARAASREDVALTVPTSGAAGSEVTVELGGLSPETHYWVGVRAFDECNAPSAVSAGEITTTRVHFTTVSPCFVATAAYGSALDARIGVLRRFRDRHLASHGPGRAVIAAYEAVGPVVAEWIAEGDTRRAMVRGVLGAVVAVAEALE